LLDLLDQVDRSLAAGRHRDDLEMGDPASAKAAMRSAT